MIAAVQVAAQQAVAQDNSKEQRRLAQSGRRLQEDYVCEPGNGVDSETCCDNVTGDCEAYMWDCMEVMDFSVFEAEVCELYTAWNKYDDPDMQNLIYCDVWVYNTADGWVDGLCSEFLIGFGEAGGDPNTTDECW